MKLFLIIYAGARIGGVAGPLPYGESECWDGANEMRDAMAKQIATGHDIQGNPITDEAKSLSFKCEWWGRRPETEPQWSPSPVSSATQYAHGYNGALTRDCPEHFLRLKSLEG